MTPLLEVLLPIARREAEKLAGSDLAADALTDVRNLEALAASHESEAAAWLEGHVRETEGKVASWLEERLGRYLPQPPA